MQLRKEHIYELNFNHKSYRDTRKIVEIITSIVISRTYQRDKSQQSNGYS